MNPTCHFSVRIVSLSLLAAATLASCAMIRRSSNDAQVELPIIKTLREPTIRTSIVQLEGSRDKDVLLFRTNGYGLAHVPDLKEYLQSLADRLVRYSPIEVVAPEVHILASESFSAMATVNGTIVVNTGTVRSVESEDEIAAVLAHEISHLVMRHGDSDSWQRAQEMTIWATGAAIEINQMWKGNSHDPKTSNNYGLKQQAFALAVNSLLISPTWNRKQEREADQLAVDLMVRAGYNPDSAIDALERRLDFELTDEGRREKNVLQEIHEKFPFSELIQAADQVEVPKQFKNDNFGIVEDWWKQFVGWLQGQSRVAVQRMTAKHPDTGERIAELRSYIAAHYATANRPSPRVDAWQAYTTTGTTGKVLNNYHKASRAIALHDEGHHRRAVKFSLESIQSPTSNHAWTRIHFAMLRKAGREDALALKNLEETFKSPEPALMVFEMAAKLHLSKKQAAPAIQVLDEAMGKFASPDKLLPLRILAYKTAGDQEKVDALMKTCRTKNAELVDLCNNPERILE